MNEKSIQCKHLVLSPGGFKGYSYLGFIKKCNLDILEAISGSSAGALMGFVVCLTKNTELLISEALDSENKIFRSEDINIHNTLLGFGINNGVHIENILNNMSEKYTSIRNLSFKELYEHCKIDYYVCTTNLSQDKCDIFSNKHTPDFSVVKAIRMSISIPFYFTPVKSNNDYYIDGCFFNSEPYEIIESNYEVCHENSFILICDDNIRTTSSMNNMLDFIMAFLKMLHNRLVNNRSKSKNMTYIYIDTHEIPLIIHKYSKDLIETAINLGTLACEKMLSI